MWKLISPKGSEGDFSVVVFSWRGTDEQVWKFLNVRLYNDLYEWSPCTTILRKRSNTHNMYKNVLDKHIWPALIVHLHLSTNVRLKLFKQFFEINSFLTHRFYRWSINAAVILAFYMTQFMSGKSPLTKRHTYTYFSGAHLQAQLLTKSVSPSLWLYQDRNCISTFLQLKKKF